MSAIAQVTSYPFGLSTPAPVEHLEAGGFSVRLSPHRRKHTSAETAALLGDVDVLVAGTEPLTAEVLARGLPRLRHVARVGVGLDGLDIGFCQRHGIAVTYTPDAPARSVVEEVFALLIGVSRRLVEAHEGLRKGQWKRLTGVLWQGRTLGILGCGRIGKQVAVVARAFGMQVLAHDIATDPAWAEANDVSYVGLDELFSRSEGVTIHLPYDASTRHLVSRQRLRSMPAGAFVINTSRGQVLDEQALHDLLVSGHLGGAGLDVYEHEPYTGPLTALDNVFLCAHQGSCSHEGRFAMEMGAAENAVRYSAGEPIAPDNVVWLPGTGVGVGGAGDGSVIPSDPG